MGSIERARAILVEVAISLIADDDGRKANHERRHQHHDENGGD